MGRKITIEIDEEVNRLLGIYKEAMGLESKQQAINQIVKKAKTLILEEVNKKIKG